MYVSDISKTMQHLASLGYPLIFLVVFCESLTAVGFFIPGSTVVIIAGSLVTKHLYNFWILLAVCVAAAVLGNTMSFTLGKLGRLSALHHKSLKKFLGVGDRFFQSFGASSVFAAHFLGPLRNIIPTIAGSSGMKQPRFQLANTLGALVWALSHLMLGYSFGTVWQSGIPPTLRITILASLSLLLFVAVLVIGRNLSSEE